MQIVISADGSARCVYDELLDVSALGQICIQRGSYVEPEADGSWWTDLEPVAGPRLGPFERKSAALVAETEWLNRHWLGNSST